MAWEFVVDVFMVKTGKIEFLYQSDSGQGKGDGHFNFYVGEEIVLSSDQPSDPD